MKALVIARYGGPEVLEFREMPAPGVGPGQERVRPKAGGLNFADILTVKGDYTGTPAPPFVAGREFAGVRERNGEFVMGYTQWGAFAEEIAANSDLLWPAPDGWSPEEAAAFPVNYFTALLVYWRGGMVDFGESVPSFRSTRQEGQRVLIHAVAGGVGTAAVQIGKLLGFEMWGTSSSDEKLAHARELGLQHPINYRTTDYEHAIREQTSGEGVDTVFEMLGGEHVTKSVRCLREFGTVVVYGSATGERPMLDTNLLHGRSTSVAGVWLSRLSSNRPLMDAAWSRLASWTSKGQLRPVIAKIVPLSEGAEAYRAMMNRETYGKVVLRIE